MKNLQKSRIIIFVMGIIFIISSFAICFLPKGYETLQETSTTELPQDVHIPININTADKTVLCLLDGIGEKTAEEIIIYREDHGAFESKEDIMNVKGIGEKTFDKIKNYIDTN